MAMLSRDRVFWRCHPTEQGHAGPAAPVEVVDRASFSVRLAVNCALVAVGDDVGASVTATIDEGFHTSQEIGTHVSTLCVVALIGNAALAVRLALCRRFLWAGSESSARGLDKVRALLDVRARLHVDMHSP